MKGPDTFICNFLCVGSSGHYDFKSDSLLSFLTEIYKYIYTFSSTTGNEGEVRVASTLA